MDLQWWLGLSSLVVIVAFVIFAFRQGSKVKPDHNNRNFSPNDPGIGGDGSGGTH
jgi:hypothetical protein